MHYQGDEARAPADRHVELLPSIILPFYLRILRAHVAADVDCASWLHLGSDQRLELACRVFELDCSAKGCGLEIASSGAANRLCVTVGSSYPSRHSWQRGDDPRYRRSSTKARAVVMSASR